MSNTKGSKKISSTTYTFRTACNFGLNFQPTQKLHTQKLTELQTETATFLDENLCMNHIMRLSGKICFFFAEIGIFVQ